MRALRRSLPILSLATLLMAATAARRGTHPADLRIAGRVVDARTDAPLRGVQILLREIAAGTLTDADGRYALSVPKARLPQGELHLRAELIGYVALDSVVPVPDDDVAGPTALTLDLRLEQAPLELDEVVVLGRAADTRVGGRPTETRATPRPAPQAPASRPRPPVAPPSRPAGAVPPPPTRASAEVADAVGLPTLPRRRPGDREQYAYIAENTFRSVEENPLSTLSIDVDRASYSNVRRFLREGRLPPVDAVQIEEMVNYFAYHYDLPRGDAPVAVTTEVGDAPWAPRHRLLRVGLASRPLATEEMPPANLVFLLDVSGSMASPDKLPLVQASMRLLVERLRSVDRVAIVVYAGAAGLVLEPTSGARKDLILDAIGRLQAGGSTAGGAGLRLAYDVARECFRGDGNNRVILATDGDFNVGESSDAAMVRLVEERRSEGTYLTVLGFGTGNLQSEKMQELAQHGNGNYAYIDGLREAHKVLVREMGGTLLTVARDVKVQVEFNPARVRAYRLLGYENRLLAAEDFNDDAKDAGDLGAGHTVTALYELVPTGTDDVPVGAVDPLRYGGDRPTPDRRERAEVAFVKIRYKSPTGARSRLIEHPVRADGSGVSTDFTFASAVAGFGMLLRGSGHRGSISADQVLALAEDGLGEDPDGDRHGFIELVGRYQALAAGTAGGPAR